MARPQRVEYPGAYYHVINRENNQGKILKNDRERLTFFYILLFWPLGAFEVDLDISWSDTVHHPGGLFEVSPFFFLWYPIPEQIRFTVTDPRLF